MGFLGLEFGTENFWDHHGLFFLFFITFFPRLTLLFSSVPFGGLFWWVGFFFVPRILVAILATVSYWEQNPILVLISWLVALSGESGEKVYANRRVKIYRTQYRGRQNGRSNNSRDVTPKNVIDVDYKKLD